MFILGDVNMIIKIEELVGKHGVKNDHGCNGQYEAAPEEFSVGYHYKTLMPISPLDRINNMAKNR